MHPLRALAVYGLAVFVGGALLAPGLYWACLFGAAHWPGLSALADVPFHRVVNRSLLALALAGLWPLLRTLRANSWAAVGLVKSGDGWRKAATGFALGFASLACAALLAVIAGARHPDYSRSLPWVWSAVGSALATAVVVACLEELLFRGAIFGSLRRAQPWPAALLLSSAIYALVHFFERPPEPAQITWASGLVVLAQMCHGFIELDRLVPGFFTLTLAGLILGLAYQRTGTLYCSIGLHAGWIFWLKLYRGLTTEQPGANAWFWGTSNLIDGWMSLLILGPVFLLVWRVFPRPEPVENEPKTVASR
jgi:membrane protease YdiL (CAAX protease family)